MTAAAKELKNAQELRARLESKLDELEQLAALDDAALVEAIHAGADDDALASKLTTLERVKHATLAALRLARGDEATAQAKVDAQNYARQLESASKKHADMHKTIANVLAHFDELERLLASAQAQYNDAALTIRRLSDADRNALALGYCEDKLRHAHNVVASYNMWGK